jgi:hypothetical protein
VEFHQTPGSNRDIFNMQKAMGALLLQLVFFSLVRLWVLLGTKSPGQIRVKGRKNVELRADD